MLDSSVLVGIIRGEPDTGRLLGLLRATNVFSCQAELVEQTAGAGPAEGVPGSDCKRVEEADAGLLEAGVVARDNDQVVDEGRGGDQAVFDRHCAPRGAKTCEQFCPPQARFSFPCQAMKPLNARGDGRSRLVRLFPLRNSKMPNLNSPRIMDRRPIHARRAGAIRPPWKRRRLGRLAQHVGVDQIPHSSSVDRPPSWRLRLGC